MSKWIDRQIEWSNGAPDDDMVPILVGEHSSIEAVKARHPSYVVPATPLTAHDRCDACGAAAAYRVHRPPNETRTAGVLEFCGHHYRRHQPQLVGAGWSLATTNEVP